MLEWSKETLSYWYQIATSVIDIDSYRYASLLPRFLAFQKTEQRAKKNGNQFREVGDGL